MKVLLIIPAYNEEENISTVIRKINNFKIKQKLYFKLDYIIINDNSTDKTKEICIKENYNVINLIENLGIGGAVQTGYIFAKKENYDIAVQFDGDGQHDILFLIKLITPIIKKEYDFIIGSRFINGKSKFKSTFLRRFGIKYLSKIIKIFSGFTILDPTSGYRVANKKVINYIAENYPEDYPEPEIIIDLLKEKFKIKEIQVNMFAREGGKSSINSWNSIYYIFKVSIAIIFKSFIKKKGNDKNVIES